MRQTLFRNLLQALPLLCGLALPSVAPAQVWEGNVSNDWSLGANWIGGVAPPGVPGVLTVINAASPAVIDGIAATNSNQGLVVGQSATGATLTIRNGGTLSIPLGLVFNPSLAVGSNAGASGSVIVTGAGSSLNISTAFGGVPVVGNAGTGVLTLSNGGLFSIAGGANTVNVASQAGSSGTINIGAAAGSAAVGAGRLTAPSITFGAGNGRLVFNHTDSNHLFGTALNGNGQVDLYAGTTAFTADSAGFSGGITVHSGAVLREQGAATRTIGNVSSTVTVLSGGRLQVNTATNVLSVGNLDLRNGSLLDLTLGYNGDTPTGTSVTVRGNITVNGAVLQIADYGEFGNGEFTLIRFSGTINSDWSMTVGSLPGGLEGEVRLSEDGQALVLVVGAVVLEESWWAGAGVHGGSGVWDNETANWTDENETLTTVWGQQKGIFAGDTAGTVTVNGEVVFSGLRFLTDGYVLNAGVGGALVAVDGAAPIIEVVGNAVTATLAAPIQSSNGLRKEGTGTLVLATNQNYSGVTTVAGGTLQLGNGGTTGMVSGNVNVQGAGTLAINRSDEITYSELIEGGGRVRQIGDGTTIFTRDQSYTGRTLVENGTLQLGVSAGNGGASGWISSSQVEVHDGATLAFSRSDNRSFGAVISGDGTLVQKGASTLTLTGNSSAFAGDTRVERGTLILNGALGGDVLVAGGAELRVNTTLGGDADVNGTLRLAGTIGGAVDLFAGGLLTGGGDILGGLRVRNDAELRLRTVTDSVGSGAATLRIGGDLLFDEGARFEVGVNRFGNADRVEVLGRADLAGTVLAVEAGSPTALWQAFNQYVILRADGGISGQFSDEVQHNFAFLDPRLSYEGNTVTLHMDRSDIRFGDLPGLSPNQQATGRAIQSMEGLVGQDLEHPVVQALLPLSVTQAQSALSQLSGELHVSTRSVLLNDTAMVQDAVMSHAGSAANPGSRFWMHGLYHDGDFEGDETAEIKRSTSGVLLGSDYLLGSHAFTLGWAVGYHRSEIDSDALHASGNIMGKHVAIYSGARWAADELPWSLPGAHSVGVRLGLGRSWNEIEMQRTVDLVGEKLSANYDANSTQVALDADARFRFADNELAPFLNASWIRLGSAGFVEESANTTPAPLGETSALQASGGSDSLALATLGVRGSLGLGQDLFTPYGDRFRLFGMLGWRHALTGDRPDALLRLRDSAPGLGAMNIVGTPLARDALVADLGLRLGFGENGSLGLAWVGQIASEVTDHAVQARFEWLLD